MSNENAFEEEMEKIEKEAGGEEAPIYTRLDDEQKAIIGIGAFLLGGILGASSNPAEPGFSFLVVGGFFGLVVWMAITKSGVAFRRTVASEMDESQQQQQVNRGRSEQTVVCRECGWQNPQSNNYCHDCGSELGAG